MKKFIYNKKDSYTLKEVEELMEDNTKFARKGYVENSEELKTQLSEYKTMKEATEIADFKKGLTERLEKNGVSNVEKILKYGKFDKDMDDKAFKGALKDLKSDFPDSFSDKTITEDNLTPPSKGNPPTALPPNIVGNVVT